MAAKRHFCPFAMFFFFSAHLKQLYQSVCHGSMFIADISKKKLLTPANFFIMYFYVSDHFEYFFIFADSAKFLFENC